MLNMNRPPGVGVNVLGDRLERHATAPVQIVSDVDQMPQ
jgi:hypothetical protein